MVGRHFVLCAYEVVQNMEQNIEFLDENVYQDKQHLTFFTRQNVVIVGKLYFNDEEILNSQIATSSIRETNLVNQKYSHCIGIIQHRVETQNNKPTFRCTMSLPVELQTMWLLTSLKTNTTTREKQYLLTKDSHYYNCNCQQYIYIQDN